MQDLDYQMYKKPKVFPRPPLKLSDAGHPVVLEDLEAPGGNRTADEDFADTGLATWPPRQLATQFAKEFRVTSKSARFRVASCESIRQFDLFQKLSHPAELRTLSHP